MITANYRFQSLEHIHLQPEAWDHAFTAKSSEKGVMNCEIYHLKYNRSSVLLMMHLWARLDPDFYSRFIPVHECQTRLGAWVTEQKWFTEHKTKLLPWLSLSSDLNPTENEWTEEKKLWIWRIWRDSGWRNGLWSLVRCSPNSSGIIGENSELLSWEKDVAIIGCQ